MLAFDMTLTKLPQSASEAIQRKTGAALPVYPGVRLVSRIDLANDTFAEPALERLWRRYGRRMGRPVRGYDGDDDESIFSFVAKRSHPHGELEGVGFISDGTTNGRHLYTQESECELRAAVHWT